MSIAPTICTSISIRAWAPPSIACSRRARIVRDALEALKMPSLVKTTGSKGLHVYVPIVRGPVQKQVWTFAKALAQELASRHPGAHHGRVPCRQAAARSRPGRLQPERVGPDPRVDLFRSSAGRRRGLDAGDVEGDRPRGPHRGLHDEERARHGSPGSETCGSRCCRCEGASICRGTCRALTRYFSSSPTPSSPST